ncbi:unnamed protein product, partial [Coregonus sp. 'balchen']
TLSPGNTFSMLEVPPWTLVYRTVHDLFYRTMSESQAQIISLQQVQDISRQNFDPRQAHRYSVRGPKGGRDTGFMFLAKVLEGWTTSVPPRLPNQTSSGRDHYDSYVNRMENPNVFVVFDSSQCYPYYLIKYKVLANNGSTM